MDKNELTQKLTALLSKQDRRDQFNAENLHTLAEAALILLEEGGGAGIADVPMEVETIEPNETPEAVMRGETLVFRIPQGEQGEEGPTGPKGSDGKSAYQVWLEENGWTGEEANHPVSEYINSLKAHVAGFKSVSYDANAPTTIGGTASAIDSFSPSADTMDKIVLMPNSDGTATIMYATTATESEGTTTYAFSCIGELAIDTSDFLSSDKIVQNLNIGGADKVPSAAAVKELNDDVVELSESINGTDEYTELDSITINLNSFKAGRFEKSSRDWDPTKGRTHILEIDEDFDAIEITANSTKPAVVTFLTKGFANNAAWGNSWSGSQLTEGGYYADNMVENGSDVGNFTIPEGEQRTFPVGNATRLAVVNRWTASEAENGRIPTSIKGMKKIHVAGNVEKRIEAVADKVKEVTYSENPIAIVQEGEGANIFSGYIDGNAGEIKSTQSANKYFLASIEGAERVAFPERVATSNTYSHGWMIGTYDGTAFTPIDKGVFETGDSTIRRKIVDVPEGATHIAVSIWLSNSSPMTIDEFYCYKITGKSLLDVIRENSTQSDIVPTIDIAQSPAALSLYNAECSNDGTIKRSTTKLLTSRIYNDFFIVVKEGYMITRVIRVDIAGNVIDPKVVVQDPEVPTKIWPAGVLDASGTAGKRAWGTYATPTGIGYIVEIAKEDLSDIDSKDVIENLLFADTNTELNTLPRYNGQTFVDSSTNNARIYSKASIDALLQRFKTIAMMQWASLKNIPLEGDEWVSIEKFKGGAIQLGVPYSRCATNNKWIGFAVSPETYLTALKNPYSVIYTENISATGKSSEYGLSADYKSSNGATYYGLVCSAYVSYMYGFMYPVSTECLGNNDVGMRNYLISEHVSTAYNGGTTETRFAKPIQVDEIPAMCAITTPGHTYFILDFILDDDGNRIAAVVTEETTPITRTALYTIERLQARFNSEYAYRCIPGGGGYVNKKTGIAGQEKIEVTVIKPSELDNRKNNLLFTPLYNVGEKMLKPYKDVDFDPNIMFYMGEKAVVMQYNTAAGYIKNTPYYLIVKPGSDYAKIIIEQQVEDGDDWGWEWIADVELQNNKVAFSDNNTEYFKVDITDTIGDGIGKFRACLSDDTEETKTGYTQWIILNSPTLTKRAGNIIEFGEPTGDTCPETENISVVFASGTNDEGGYSDSQGASGEISGNDHDFNTQSSSTDTDPKAVIVVKCDWGAAARCVRINELS